MPTIQKASDLLNQNESAVAVFTHGDYFSFAPSTGIGESGNWVFLGNYAGCKSSGDARRYVIHISGMKEVGGTGSNWLEFGHGGQRPVCYVNRESKE
jgi:hypothetical protein